MGDMSWPESAGQKGLIGLKERTGFSVSTPGASSPLSPESVSHMSAFFLLYWRRQVLFSNIKTFLCLHLYIHKCKTVLMSALFVKELFLLPSLLGLPHLLFSFSLPNHACKLAGCFHVAIHSHRTIYTRNMHTHIHSAHVPLEGLLDHCFYYGNIMYASLHVALLLHCGIPLV